MNNILLIVKLVLIIVSGYILYKAFGRLLDRIQDNNHVDEQVYIIVKSMGKWFLVVFSLLLVFHQFGIEAGQILTALSAVLVLLAVGFVAAWSVLSNILCGMLLLIFSPFRFGDEIEIREADKEAGFKGKLIGLSLFFTTLEYMADNGQGIRRIKIPNIMFFQRITICHEGKNTASLKLKKVVRKEESSPPDLVMPSVPRKDNNKT